ncbi:MAG: diguanylate cyclase, partial [Pseudomonadota bacterium]|nr:diguanylate cyclase [Pseudomonadota bacterium]
VWVLMPQLLTLPSPAQLRATNAELHHEIHEHHRLLVALRESEERFRSAFDYAAIGMAVVSLDGHWLKVNQALCSIVGYREEELLATDFQTLTHADDLGADLEHVQALLDGSARHYHMEKRYFHKTGAVVWVLLSVALVRDDNGAPLYFVTQIQDITERKRAEAQLRQIQQELEARVEERTRALEASNRQLERLARCDELTGLYNRRHLMELLNKAFYAAKRYNEPLAVMMLDIDHFKRINDTYGHAAGDRVLTVVGRLLRENLRTADITGRYGGEEFCIALVHTPLADAVATAEKLRRQIAATAVRVEDDGPPLHITCSIGISQWLPYTTDLQELLEQADKALYQAKQGGRNRVMPPWPANPAAWPARSDGSANA